MTKGVDRREFLSNSALSLAALARPLWAATGPGAPAPAPIPPATPATPAAAPQVPPLPVARVEVVKDTYFGETLSDPYRWMENSKDPDWLPFLKAENEHARAILDALPSRAGFLKRITQLTGETAVTGRVQRASGLTGCIPGSTPDYPRARGAFCE